MTTFDDLYAAAKDLPIIDWHNHLDMRMLAEDKPLGSLYETWVKSDPYKHRAMRICGEPERLITGDASEDEKWAAWTRTLPKLVGNPIFAWAKMEMEFLGLDASAYLRGEGENLMLSDLTPSKLLSRFKVEYMSPCVAAAQLGERASRPFHWENGRLARSMGMQMTGQATGETPVVPVCNGRDARCPSRMYRPPTWTAAEVKEFSSTQATSAAHFSGTLQSGDFHRRNLPHVGQNSTLVFVTFRLADSLPQTALDDMAEFREEWLREHSEPWDEATCSEWHSAVFARSEKWLDAGHGSCMLADPRLRKVVEDALEFYNGRDARCPSERRGKAMYQLHGYIVMPNHVHVLMELFDGEDLAKVVQAWKSFTAKELNRITGSSGRVWMAEYYDRLIRNAEHYENTLQYIRKNGEVAKGLAREHGGNVPPGERASRPFHWENGRLARSMGMQMTGQATGETPVVPVASNATGETPVVPVCNGRDARSPSIVPSLRMNAGEEVAEEALARFHAAGCRVVDISVDDAAQLETCYDSLASVAAFAAAHGWTMLLHMGALRETSTRLRAAVGPAGGYAGMRSPVDPAAVAAFLNRLESTPNIFSHKDHKEHKDELFTNDNCHNCSQITNTISTCSTRLNASLPRTILMTLNPEAHAQLATLAGSFVEEGVPGKVQLGPAWWWCDHAEGIRDVLEKQAAYGVLSTFVGMTTDSRSLLSFVRHDYFRRLFCRWVADKVSAGDFPDDRSLLLPLVEKVCYANAKGMLK